VRASNGRKAQLLGSISRVMASLGGVLLFVRIYQLLRHHSSSRLGVQFFTKQIERVIPAHNILQADTAGRYLSGSHGCQHCPRASVQQVEWTPHTTESLYCGTLQYGYLHTLSIPSSWPMFQTYASRRWNRKGQTNSATTSSTF
jgi:hypothetical protein